MTPPLASLPMYDWPEIRPATDRLWDAIARRLAQAGIAAPAALTRGADGFWPAWENPGLVLSQTCGLPYRSRLHARVALVGTPDYGLPGAAPGHYYSELVVRKDAPGGFDRFLSGRLAFNSAESQSGWAAPQNHAARHGARFTRLVETGSHVESAEAVAAGRAEIAAIDAVTWRLILRHRPRLAAALWVLGRTAPTPGLPLIAAPALDAAQIAAAVAGAIADITPADRETTGLRGLARIPAAAYLAVPTPPPPGAGERAE